MKLTRRGLLGGMGALALCQTGGLSAQAKEGHEVELGEDGLHRQDWFVESFLDLRDDLKDAKENGKHFAIIWEQPGCPYCAQMHKVNFSDPKMRDYLKANFHILQLNYRGVRKVIDFDGKEMGERQLARRWRVNFTPTMTFYPLDPAMTQGKIGRQAEVFRMPGYFKPFHFISSFEYVRSERTKEIRFQDFIREKARKQKEG